MRHTSSPRIARKLLVGASIAARADYYRHDTLPESALRWGILDADLSDDLALLRDRRVKADYWEDNVDIEEASDAVDIAKQFVALLEQDSQ